MPPPSMPRKRSSPLQTSPSPEAPRQVLPRSKAPRAHSNPTSATGGMHPPRRPSNQHAQSHPVLLSGQAVPKDWKNEEVVLSSEGIMSPGASGSAVTSADVVSGGIPGFTAAAAAAAAGAGIGAGAYTPPTSVPSLSSGPSAPTTAATAPSKKDRSNSGSSTGTSGLGSLLAPMSTGTAASTGPTPPPAEIPQTGLGKMAAAAKARVQGIPARRNSDIEGHMDVEDEGHPLSETSLRARDYHTILTMNRLFHVPNRWKLIRPLGQGAYGLVIQVQDEYTAEPVAVKCITRVFDKVILARRALREITLLRHFGGHENLTGLIDLDHVWDGYNEIYLYMEPMEADLHQIVRSGQPLSNSHIQFFIYQLLRGMKYIHSANVIHRDLKPGNLLVNSDCELKICDFGLARGYQPAAEDALKLTEYVATRWYRAPEVMLSNSTYTTAMDVWSIGCILAEVLGGKPLFKGKDYVDQINLIVAAVGTPDEEVLTRVGSEKACHYMRSLPFAEPKDLQSILPLADPSAIDLLRHLITFDPDARFTVVQALEHPYVETYHDETDEPTCPAPFDKWKQVESLDTIEELRAAITREISEYRAEVRDATYMEDDYSDRGSSLGAWEAGDVTMTGTPDELHQLSGTGSGSGADGAGMAIPGAAAGESAGLRPSSVAQPASYSPRSTYPAQIGLGVSPLASSSAIPAYRGRERERPTRPGAASPRTPASVFTDDSTPGPSQPPSAHPTTSASAPSQSQPPVPGFGGRTSRRSSAHSTHRARSSFLFSSPLGGGMTPLPSMSALMPMTMTSANASANAAASSSTGGESGMMTGASASAPTHVHPHAHAHGHRPSMDWAQGRKSRTTSTASEFASLRPLIRQLSVVGLDGLGIGDGDGNMRKIAPGGQEGSAVPMTVSPSDAPPSEVPKSFANTPQV